MVIGFDGSRAFSEHKTGTEQYSYQLLRAISLEDKENSYIVYLRPGVDIDTSDWPENFKFEVLNYKYLWTQVGLSIATFKDNLDLLFVPSHTLPLLKKTDLDTIMTVHDLGAEFLPSFHQLKQQLYLKFITDVQLKTATHLIAVSNSTKQDLITKVGISKEKITVIYEGLNRDDDLTRTSLESENEPKIVNNELEVDILNQFDIEKRNYFLFIGTVQPRKNLVRLIKAFKGFCNLNQNDNFKLVIAGSKGWLSDDIYSLPKTLGIQNQVHFLGRVSDLEKKVLYQNARALTFPSLFEGFGLPVLEAFSNRCPVITSTSSSLPEVAGKAAILVNPESINELIQAMIDITVDSDLREQLVTEGVAQLQKFSWQKAAQETLQLFKEIKTERING